MRARMLAGAHAAPAAPPAEGGPIPPDSAPLRVRRLPGWLAVPLAHLLLVLWLFGGTLLGGRLLYYRDIALQFAPDAAFAAASLGQGVWPLWNPTAHAGEPALFAYPVDLLLLLVAGPRAPIGVGVALHLWLALVGASLLARRLGMGTAGAWIAGVVYGLGGFVLSAINLLPLFEAAAWAPWVLAALVAVARGPSGLRVALLALVAAVETSTLGAEIVLQTAVFGLVLVAGEVVRRPRRGMALVGAGLLAALLAAPALLGARALVFGSARDRGFASSQVLAFSLHPVVLAETLLPAFLGEPHAFSDATHWARTYFPAGFPYLLSLYLGPGVLLLAAQARGHRRLWALAALGVVLSLGGHGPLALVAELVRLPLRGPQKLFYLVHLSVSLLAGFGLERLRTRAPRGRVRLLLLVPGATLVALALALRVAPEAMRDLGASVVPALLDPRGLVVVRSVWPGAWLASGALALGLGLGLARGGRLAVAASVLVALDLATVNGALNPLTPASFYDLRPEIKTAVLSAAAEGHSRFYSYGLAYTPGLEFEPAMARARSDAWLFYIDRQSLLPRTPALNGLESALGVDRTGWTPAGAALSVAETDPERFAQCVRRLRLAGVRWVLCFRPLPENLVSLRTQVKLPELVEPLRLYELRGWLPRAYWVPRFEVEADATKQQARLEDSSFDPRTTVLLGSSPRQPQAAAEETGEPRVEYEARDAHTVRIHARTPPGFVVVLDGHHPDWVAEDQSGPVPLLRADGRYRAIATPGGDHTFTMRYRPAWRARALVLSVVGLLATLAVAWLGGPGVSDFTGGRARRVLDSLPDTVE
jgi:hypothetical protein